MTKYMKNEFLKDGEIRLRAVEPDDAAEMWEIESDSRQWFENGMMAPLSYFNLHEYALKYDNDPFRTGQIRLIAEIFDAKNEKYLTIGVFDLYDISPQRRTAFVGIYLKQTWRKDGFADRILTIGENYAAKLLNLRILGAKVCQTNKPSINLFERNGYKLAGILNDWLISGKQTYDLLIFTKSLTKAR